MNLSMTRRQELGRIANLKPICIANSDFLCSKQCYECVEKRKAKPRFRILWSHNLFANSMFATDERPILGYFIQDITKLPSLAGAKYYSL